MLACAFVLSHLSPESYRAARWANVLAQMVKIARPCITCTDRWLHVEPRGRRRGRRDIRSHRLNLIAASERDEANVDEELSQVDHGAPPVVLGLCTIAHVSKHKREIALSLRKSALALRLLSPTP